MGWPLEARRSLFPDWPLLCDESSSYSGALHIPVQILAGKFQMERVILIFNVCKIDIQCIWSREIRVEWFNERLG